MRRETLEHSNGVSVEVIVHATANRLPAYFDQLQVPCHFLDPRLDADIERKGARILRDIEASEVCGSSQPGNPSIALDRGAASPARRESRAFSNPWMLL